MFAPSAIQSLKNMTSVTFPPSELSIRFSAICQLSAKILAICQLSVNPIQTFKIGFSLECFCGDLFVFAEITF